MIPFILEFDPIDGKVEFAAQTIGGAAAHKHSGDKYLHVFHDARLFRINLQIQRQAHLLFIYENFGLLHGVVDAVMNVCLLYTSPSPRD